MHHVLRAPALALATVSLAVVPVLAPAVASAEPHPWHQGAQESSHAASTRTKARIEHDEWTSTQAIAPSAGQTPKAQIEYDERVAAQATGRATTRQGNGTAVVQARANRTAALATRHADWSWAMLGFLGLGAAAAAIGLTAYRSGRVRAPHGMVGGDRSANAPGDLGATGGVRPGRSGPGS